MKKKLFKRIATALVFAGFAFSMTGCGSNNNNNLNPYGIGSFGGALSGNGQCVPLGPTIQFSGIAQYTGQSILAGQNVGSQLYMQTTSGVTGGSYLFGRYGSDAMIGMNLQAGGYGGQAQINGVLQFNQTSWSLLQSQLGQATSGYGFASYPSTYSSYGSFSPYSSYMGGSNLCLTAIQSINLGAETNPNPSTYGPFSYVLFGGNVVLMVSGPMGQNIPVTVPF